MKCIKCNHVMNDPAALTLSAEVRGERFDVPVIASRCPNCGHVSLNAKARRMFHRGGSDAYKRAHDLLTAADLDRLRRDLGMTWRRFADYVGIGIATLKRWLGGEIQSDAYNELVRLKADLEYADRMNSTLVARLAEQCSRGQQTIDVPVRPRRRVHHVEMAADGQYALAA